MRNDDPDWGARATSDLAYIHYLFTCADEFYRVYRESLLNLECNRAKPKPKEWIPISDH
jgi:hypothetical protein